MALDEFLKLWQEAKADPDWQNLDPAEQTLLKQRFYQQVIKPLGPEAGTKFLETDNPELAFKGPAEETAGRAFGRGFARNLTGTAARALGVGGLSLEEPTAIRPEDVYKTAAAETLGEFADPASLLLGFGTSKLASPLVKQGVSRLVSRGMAPGSAAAIGAAGAGVVEGGIEGGLQAAIEPEVQPGTRARSVLESAALGALFGGAFAAPGAYAAARQAGQIPSTAGTPDMTGTTTGLPAQPRGVVPAVTPVPGVTAPAEAAVMTPIGLDLSSVPTDRLLLLNEQMQQDPRFRGVEAEAVQAEILRRQEDAATRGFEAQQAAARGRMRQPWSGRLENLPTTGEPLELTRAMNDIASLEQQIQRAAANLESTGTVVDPKTGEVITAQRAAQNELNTLFGLLDEARAREASIRQRASLPPAEPTSIFQAMPQREAPAPAVQEAPPVQPAGPVIPEPRLMSVAEFQAAEDFNNRINALLGGPPPAGRPGGEAPAVTPEMIAAAERGGATMVPQLPAKTTTMAELQRREQAQAAQAAVLGLVPQQRIIPVDQAATALRKATKAVQDQEDMVKAMRERGAPQDQISAAEDALRAARNEQFSATEDMRTAQAQSRRFAQQEAEALAARVARQKDAAEAKVRQEMQEEAARRAAKRAKKAEQPPAEGGQPPSEGGQPPTGGAQGRRPRTPTPKPPAPKTPKAPAKITEEDLRQAGVLRPDGRMVSNNEAGSILKDATSDLRKANKAFKDNPTEANKAAVDQAKTQVKFADNLQKTLKKYVSQEGAPSPKAGEPETPSTTEQAKTTEPPKPVKDLTDEELAGKARQLAKQIEKKLTTLQILEDKAQVASTGSNKSNPELISSFQNAFDREIDALDRLDKELFDVQTEEKTRKNKAFRDEVEAKQLAKKEADAKKAEAAQKKAAAKELAAKKPAAKEPAAKEPAAKEPAAKEPAAKEPAAKEPAAKELLKSKQKDLLEELTQQEKKLRALQARMNVKKTNALVAAYDRASNTKRLIVKELTAVEELLDQMVREEKAAKKELVPSKIESSLPKKDLVYRTRLQVLDPDPNLALTAAEQKEFMDAVWQDALRVGYAFLKNGSKVLDKLPQLFGDLAAYATLAGNSSAVDAGINKYANDTTRKEVRKLFKGASKSLVEARERSARIALMAVVQHASGRTQQAGRTLITALMQTDVEFQQNLGKIIPPAWRKSYVDLVQSNDRLFDDQQELSAVTKLDLLRFTDAATENIPTVKETAKNREALGLSKDVDPAKPIDKMTTPKKGTKRIVKLDDDGNPEVINNPCKD